MSSEVDGWMLDYLSRDSRMKPFPRQMLRKRFDVSSFAEFKSVVNGYNGRSDVYTSLYSNFQMQNAIYDCIFLEIDCYVEMGETVQELNKYARIVEDFLFDKDLSYRRFFSGKKGLHYYIPFPPYHFSFFSNAVRQWAKQIPKVERPDFQYYLNSGGEVKIQKTQVYDTRTIGNPAQLVRMPYTIHPKTGIRCIECYGPITLPLKRKPEAWLHDRNASLLNSLRLRDREPDMVDKSGPIVFDFGNSPRCIRNALSAASGRHPTHDQAFHLANFMITLGATDKEILSCFQSDPKFNESTAKAQIESLRRVGYSNMSCDKIAFIGLCDAKQKLECAMWPSIDRYLYGEST